MLGFGDPTGVALERVEVNVDLNMGSLTCACSESIVVIQEESSDQCKRGLIKMPESKLVPNEARAFNTST